MAEQHNRSAVEEVVSLEEGKYRLIRYKNGALSALRHGEPWRDLTGDKLVGALLDRLLDAEAHLKEIGRVPPGCEWPFGKKARR